MKTIRIGSGAGYGGDRIEPALDLIRRGHLGRIGILGEEPAVGKIEVSGLKQMLLDRIASANLDGNALSRFAGAGIARPFRRRSAVSV